MPFTTSTTTIIIIVQKEARAYGLGLLDGLGVKKGDKVAVYCSNEIDGVRD